MKVTLTITQADIEELIKRHIERLFTREIEISDVNLPDNLTVDIEITDKPVMAHGGSTTNLPKARGKPISTENTSSPDVEETHYAHTPTLTDSEQTIHLQILNLLNNNILGRNKSEIEKLYKDAPENVKITLNANPAYKDFLANSGSKPVFIQRDGISKSGVNPDEIK